jgi:hypothetical protein
MQGQISFVKSGGAGSNFRLRCESFGFVLWGLPRVAAGPGPYPPRVADASGFGFSCEKNRPLQIIP